VGTRRHLLRRGICAAIEAAGMEVAWETDDYGSLLEQLRHLKPEIALVSFDLSEHNGETLVAEIKEIMPTVGVIVICKEKIDNICCDCFMGIIAKGGSGCISAFTSEKQLILAIQCIQNDTAAVSSNVLQKAIMEITKAGKDAYSPAQLSVQELEVLRLASKGMSSKSIAEQSSFSVRAVHGHFHSIFRKMGVRSRTEAIYKALKNGWINLS